MSTLTGGTKLDEALRSMAEKVSKPATLRVGFLEGATYPKRAGASLRKEYSRRRRKGNDAPIRGAKSGTVSVPMVAAIQEFGAPSRGIPPRPYFRNMIAAKSGEWPEAIAYWLQKNDWDAEKTLSMTGEAIVSQLRWSIVETNSPPLSPKTIARKGFSKPLIDTSHMINSVDYEVNT